MLAKKNVDARLPSPVVPVGIIDSWLKGLVVGWLSKALGIPAAEVSAGLDAIIAFIQSIYKFFGPKEAVRMMKYASKNPVRVFRAVQTSMKEGG